MTADPFSPGGVVFRPVSGNLVTVRLISAGLSLGIPLLALAALAVWVTPWFWLGAAVPLALPLAGRVKGAKVTARQVKDRLDRELVGNVSLRVLPTARPDASGTWPEACRHGAGRACPRQETEHGIDP